MRTVLLAAGVTLALASAAQARVPAVPLAQVAHERAQADILPVKNDKYKWKGGGCKYEFKANHKGFKEKYKCK
jgi:hypothetical protein